MSLLYFKCETEKGSTAEAEVQRLSAPSQTPCPNCGGTLTIGEDEISGCCSTCYFKISIE